MPAGNGIPGRYHVLASGGKSGERQIQTVVLAQHLQTPRQAHHLRIAVKLEKVLRRRQPCHPAGVRFFDENSFEVLVFPQLSGEPVLNCAFAGMAEGRISHVVKQGCRSGNG